MADGVKRTVETAYATFLTPAGSYADAPRGAEVLVAGSDVERFDKYNKPADALGGAELANAVDSEPLIVDVTDDGSVGRRGPALPQPPKGKGV